MTRTPSIETPADRARYYEDYTVGEIINAPGVTLTESDIIEFAFRYDPQAFHTDVEFAKDSIYGGLIASGWQVGAVAFRMLVQAGFVGRGSMGSPGINDLRWPNPVRPGDTLYARTSVLSKRDSRSRPELGLVTMDYVVENQHGILCCAWNSVQLVMKRPPTA
ncbi:MAG: MaoC family dehydratase [Minwuia sp.]|nr:MaoC family dehydratase [Minwuia sp.]